MLLSYINLALIILIMAVVALDTYFIIEIRGDIDKLEKKMLDGSSIIDLAEFDNLDPELKKQYRKFIVNRAMPPLMKKINKAAEDTNLVKYLDKNEYEVNQYIKEFTDQV